MEIKSIEPESYFFTGYANVTEIVDEGGDIIHSGAFKRTIDNKKGHVPVLAKHDFREEIGYSVGMREDARGLYVETQLYKNVKAAQEEYERIKARQEIGMPMGLSIGFTIPKGKHEYDEKGVHHIYEVNLWEYSTTPFPMNPESMVAEAKQDSPMQIEKALQAIIGLEQADIGDHNRKLYNAALARLQSLLCTPTKSDSQEPDNNMGDSERILHSLREIKQILEG